MQRNGFRGLKVYQLAYQLALDIYKLSKSFPREEKYSLTDQIRRSSRSVCSNIAEAYQKRRYPKYFVNKLSDADAESSETQVWLDFAKDLKYLDIELYNNYILKYEEIGRMLGKMINNPQLFQPRK